jgi:hypothetical protein
MGLKSPLDGCWDGRGRTELWRALAQRRRRTPSSGRLWQRFDPWGSAPCRWDDGLGDQNATRASWTISGACGSVLGLFGTCDRLQEPQRGQRFAPWMLIMPKKGQRLPSRGLTSPFLAHFGNFSIKCDK